MITQGTLLHCAERVQFINGIQDPVTRSLVNLAFIRFVQKVHLEKQKFPTADLDMLFLVTTLKDFFSEHDLIARTLEGERTGAFFEADT
jgi:hypothetical protein